MDKRTAKAIKESRKEFKLIPDPPGFDFTSKKGSRVKIIGTEKGPDDYWRYTVLNKDSGEYAVVDPDKFWAGVKEKRPKDF